MTQTTRVALLHTGAVVIPMTTELIARELPGATAINYLDDRIVADLGDPSTAASVPRRVVALCRAASEAGAQAVLLTCSSISELAAPTSQKAGLPVLRIDEAMADEAVASGQDIAVLATLPTTCGPTTRLIGERAALIGASPSITSQVVPGAFDAVVSGDREEHDRLVAEAIRTAARRADVVVLAQASMAGAATAITTSVPVLSSLQSGVKRMGSVMHSLSTG